MAWKRSKFSNSQMQAYMYRIPSIGKQNKIQFLKIINEFPM